jgi:putative nucleotidyltransferase with HDIG domain
LGDKSEEKKNLWDHSYKTAFFAYNLARNLHRGDPSILDDVYLGGILHDIGRIILLQSDPAFIKNIYSFCEVHNVSRVAFEHIITGLNHAEIGARIAEKWNFPQNLVAAIRYHHTPLSAPPQFSVIVNIVYLADRLNHYAQGSIRFDDIEPSVLTAYNITKPEQLQLIVDKLKVGLR